MNKLLTVVVLVTVSAYAVTSKDTTNDLRSDGVNQTFSRVGNVMPLTDDFVKELYVTYWPDGTKMLFETERDSTHNDLYTVTTDGSKVKTKISPGNNTYEYPDVNSTGSYVCYATGDDINEAWEIGVMTVPGGVETIITDNEATYGLDSHFPRFSGSGDKIAYVQRDSATYTDRIVTTDIDGSNETIICTLPSGSYEMVYTMDWLGNINSIIFTNLTGRLYKVATTAGSTPTQIGTGSGYHRAQSNAAGTKIVASETWGSGPNSCYYTLNPDGTDKTLILNPDDFPVFDKIACHTCFTADADGVIALGTLVSNPSFFDLFLVDESEYCGIDNVSLGTLKAAFK